MSMDPTDTFRQEARELIETLEQQLLDLERTPTDADLINGAFRALHTIKGSGAMFGFVEVADFVHQFETVFDRVRKGQSAVTPELIAIALDAKDHVNLLIESPDASVSASDGARIVAALQAITEGAVLSDDSSTDKPVAGNETRSGPARWRIRFTLPEDCLVNGTNPLLLLEEIREIGPCTIKALTDAVPPLEDIDPEAAYLGWQVDLDAENPHSAIEDVFLFIRDDMELTIEPLEENEAVVMTDSSAPALDPAGQNKDTQPARIDPVAATPQGNAKPAAGPEKAAAAAGAATSLRVAAERLDELMDRVGELVIAQSRLTQIAAGSSDLNLKSIAEELERLSSGLRDTTMGIRMVPIGTLFGRFRRLVHDLSRDLGKEIAFVTAGEETELDKTMIERLADPLVHLIRNSIDHGLEDAEARSAAGKPTKGTVRLSAVYSGAEVTISVSDDGAGLDPERIRMKAEEAGLLAPEAKITDPELWQMILAPGFSTAKEVTALSGRGVGMDVVKRTIDGLRGAIEIASTRGEGTTITLRLPLTLAIIDGMLVRVGSGQYTIPLSAVVECVELPDSVEVGSRGRSFLDIRGELVPFLSLRELFQVDGDPDTHQKVVIVQCGEDEVGLVVDQILGNNQTVIKQLSKLHSDLKSFSGATILGDGAVALILDTVNLVNMGKARSKRFAVDEKGEAA